MFPLPSSGYTVIEARNGEQAIEAANRHKGEIHLLLTDVVMPGMSGHQAAKALAAAYPAMKILFVSGYAEKGLADKDATNPQLRFLQKPFTPIGLARKVREVLDAKAGPRP